MPSHPKEVNCDAALSVISSDLSRAAALALLFEKALHREKKRGIITLASLLPR